MITYPGATAMDPLDALWLVVVFSAVSALGSSLFSWWVRV
jgi:hypothetical protein